jgi:plasmid stabilization system protein ParE
MRIELSKNAAAFLRQERLYLEQFNPRAAANVLLQLRKALRFLADYPKAGSPYNPLDGRRRYVSGDYVIDYRIDAMRIAVSHIRHGRQLSPDLPRDDGDAPES